MATNVPSEILQTIFKELENQHLSKCLLVCGYWCSNILPILWSNPLEIYRYQVIEIYISCLSKKSKRILREYNIIHEATKDNCKTTYNYTGYLKEVEFNELYEACWNWLYRIGANNPNPSIIEDVDEDYFATRLFNRYFHYAKFGESRSNKK